MSSTQTGAEMIAAERQRQIDVEGYTPERDAMHDPQDLADAARAYLALPTDDLYPPVGWPWDMEFWKPTPGDRVRELVKAGALIAAAIDAITNEAPR